MGQLPHLFCFKYKPLLIFGAPKLYYNFGGRVKGFSIDFFYVGDRNFQWAVCSFLCIIPSCRNNAASAISGGSGKLGKHGKKAICRS